MTTVFKNGHIYTMNQEMPYVSATVVQDDKIVYVGTDAGAAAYESDAKVIDLAGKMLIPGMVDAHCHPMLHAFLTSGILLDAEMTKADVMEEIAGYIAAHPDNETYFGIGYPEWVFDDMGPTKEELDAICKNKPVFLMSNGGHEGWCNSLTFERLHITKDTPDPMPGYSYFRRNQAGELTGNIIETVAEQVIMDHLAWFDTERVTQLYHDMFDKYSALGVTGFVDCGAFDNLETKSMAYMKGLEERGELKQRFCSCVMVEDRARISKAVGLLKERNAKFHSDLYNINTLKIVNDGTVESKSASMFEPYSDDASTAEPMVQGEPLYQVCLDAAAAGFDIHIHGIGDRTIHETLMAAKAVREAGYYDTRIINAHTHVVNAKDIPLFGKYNVLANTSSIWHYCAPEAEPVLGARFYHQFEMVSIMKAGGRVTLGSDMPFDEMGSEPLKGIQMGVTRALCNHSDRPILEPASEKMTVQECLEAYTINAVYGMHLEKKTGSIEVGKYADLVVLEKDLNEIPSDTIAETKILLTMLNGKATYVNELFGEDF